MYQEKLKQVRNELTQTEKIIADFFQNHSLEARSFTSYQLADRLNIGQSTIIRFSKKLGYRSFRELLEDLSTSLTEEKVKEEIVVNEGTSSTNQKIIQQYQKMAQLTLEFNPPQVIDQTVSALRKARKIIVFGFGNSNLFAEYISNQWLKMGLDSFCSCQFAYHFFDAESIRAAGCFVFDLGIRRNAGDFKSCADCRPSERDSDFNDANPEEPASWLLGYRVENGEL